MAVAAYRLNLLAAAFFPVATVSAVFGMTIAHGVESSPTTFWGIVALALVVWGVFG